MLGIALATVIMIAAFLMIMFVHMLHHHLMHLGIVQEAVLVGVFLIEQGFVMLHEFCLADFAILVLINR